MEEKKLSNNCVLRQIKWLKMRKRKSEKKIQKIEGTKKKFEKMN